MILITTPQIEGRPIREYKGICQNRHILLTKTKQIIFMNFYCT